MKDDVVISLKHGKKLRDIDRVVGGEAMSLKDVVLALCNVHIIRGSRSGRIVTIAGTTAQVAELREHLDPTCNFEPLIKGVAL